MKLFLPHKHRLHVDVFWGRGDPPVLEFKCLYCFRVWYISRELFYASMLEEEFYDEL